MPNPTRLIIFGDRDFSQIAYEYFTYDSPYEVVGFTVDQAHIGRSELCGLPVVPFEEVEHRYPPGQHMIFVAVVYAQLNRVREQICRRAKDKGYMLASYVSSKAFVWRNVTLGEHCFVFENNTLQPFVTVGDNVVIWSGNHIGHHSRIGSHCFIASHVVISGWCEIGDHCFLGVNSTLANNTCVGSDSWISHGTLLSSNLPAHSIVKASESQTSELNEAALFRSLARASKVRK